MTDRKILHFPSDWTPSDGDKEGQALYDMLHARETDVSAMHPLEIWLGREFLIEETDAAIQAIKRNTDWAALSEVQRNHIAAVLQQRVEFLEWLQSETTERVFLAVYPVDDTPGVALGEEEDADELPPSTGDYGSFGSLDTIERDDDLPL